MRMHSIAVGLSVLVMLAAATAEATVRGNPVKIRLVGEPRAAAAGQVYTGALEIVAAKDVQVTNLRLEGERWRGRLTDAATSLGLTASEKRVFRFEATPEDPEKPLVVAYELDGRPMRRSLDLSARAARASVGPGALVPLTPGFEWKPRFETAPLPNVEFPRDTRISRATQTQHEKVQVDDSPGPLGIARTIRVHGQIAYTRPDGVPIGADNVFVEVIDLDDIDDDELGSDLTNAFGYFDIDVSTADAGEANPDLYVYVECWNAELQVQSDVWEVNYSWRTRTRHNFDGSDLDLGTVTPDLHAGALHIFTDIIRDWRWYMNETNPGPIDLPATDVQWPDDNDYGSDAAWYDPYWEEIHIGSDRTWRENTHAHEYGHHFIKNRANWQESDYCNGICDEGPGCGHCSWCPENWHDAWSEGFPDWISQIQTTSYRRAYGDPAQFNYEWEELKEDPNNCPGGLSDPVITEGFCAAVLLDICDNTPGEDDPLSPGAWEDRLSLGWDEIVAITDALEPNHPVEFLLDMLDVFPAYREDIWETAKNCTYEIDFEDPAMVTDLGSSSHAIADPASPDARIRYTWTRAEDDASGVSGYSILWGVSPITLPDETEEIGDVTSYTTPPLEPGDWWFHIRTHDRSGKWSADAAHFGPIDIRERRPINLVYYDRPGWAHVLVPREAADATISVVPAPVTLPGNSSGTYWNVSGSNTGDDPTDGPTDIHFLLDGLFRATYTWGGPVGAGATYYALNRATPEIAGGRHTAEGVLDAGEDIHEADEVDNLWAHQWVWTPYELSPGTHVGRPRPPERDGGWDAIVDGSSRYYNCDGLRFTSSGWWNAVAVWINQTDDDHDYDCRMHPASTGATSGFTSSSIGWSSRPAGCVDAVLANRNQTGVETFDVGVLHYDAVWDPFGPSYRAKHVTSILQDFNTVEVVTLPADDVLLLREFQVTSSDTGWVSMAVEITGGGIPIHMLWLADDFDTGDLNDYSAQAVTDTAGLTRLDVYIAQAGYNCLALYRDPRNGLGQVDMAVEIGRTKPDLVPVFVDGWHAPLVPRPAADGAPASVPAPDTLYGNADATYWNWAFANRAPVVCPGQTMRVYVDGVVSISAAYPEIGRHETKTRNIASPRTVTGGRHTVFLSLDNALGIAESDETNNTYGEQWVWSPLELTPGMPTTRAAPPDPTAGWTEIDSEEPRYYNCDGLRTPVFAPSGEDGYWGAVAVMPSTTSDVDLRLHEVAVGTKDGFGAYLAASTWSGGLSEFVLAGFRLTGFRAFDVGVVRGEGTDIYFATVSTSVFRGSEPEGTYGPFTIAAGEILDLHEFHLTPGVWEIQLEHLAGDVDWGMTLHGAPGDTAAYYTRELVLDGGAAWENGLGLDESMQATVPGDGYYCLAVWKTTAADFVQEGQYRLHIVHQGVDVPGEPPIAYTTALAPPRPNPSRDAAVVAFELAADAEVVLEVYNIQGARVRTLARGTWPAGRHQLNWDGTDEHGRRLRAGLFVVRMVAGRQEMSRKLVLLE